MGSALVQVTDWSRVNNLGINGTKTKDVLISFGIPPQIETLELNGIDIERVHSCKLLGLIISDNLTWDANTENINKKAGLRCLKRAGLNINELLKVYLAIIRSVCEYACPVWATSLKKSESKILESIQKRALRIMLPNVPYETACSKLNLPTLATRRQQLCTAFFKSMSKPDNSLNDMLPSKRSNPYNTRSKQIYQLPRCKTKRYKNSLVPWCLYNCQ